MSVLLPVHNGQQWLEADVARILDVLSELADEIELVIVDDGSTDDTIEVARHLSVLYPQVQAVRHPLRMGLAEVVRTGLDLTRGETVFVGDEQQGVDPEDLRRLWPLRNDRELVLARKTPVTQAEAGWLDRLLGWTPKQPARAGGVQMLRRRELDTLRRQDAANGNRRIDRPAAPSGTRVGAVRPIYLQKQTRATTRKS